MQIHFTIVVDTMTLNLTKMQVEQYNRWNFPTFNDTNSHQVSNHSCTAPLVKTVFFSSFSPSQFLMEVASRLGDAEISKYWISRRLVHVVIDLLVKTTCGPTLDVSFP